MDQTMSIIRDCNNEVSLFFASIEKEIQLFYLRNKQSRFQLKSLGKRKVFLVCFIILFG